MVVDRDQDGLDDAQELAWAAAYLPYLSISPSDGTRGVPPRNPHARMSGPIVGSNAPPDVCQRSWAVTRRRKTGADTRTGSRPDLGLRPPA